MSALTDVFLTLAMRKTTRSGERVFWWDGELAAILLDSGEIGPLTT